MVTYVDIYKYCNNNFIDELNRQAGTLPAEERKNIIFVNSTRDLTDKDYFILDNHINASGHKKVAARLLEAIQQNSVNENPEE